MMKKQRVTRLVSACIALVMLVACYSQTAEAAKTKKWDVKRGEVNYDVELKGATDLFIGNKKSVGTKVGTEYYMTYAVESIDAKEFRQNGVVGTGAPLDGYPYVTTEDGRGGLYQYEWKNQLLKEGYSYFLKFTITKDGYEYRVAYAKEDEAQYIYFNQMVGEVKSGLGYFGVFFGDLELNGKLVKVRCYDKDGNDLGVQMSSIYGETSLEGVSDAGARVKDNYTVTIRNAYNLAISNREAMETDTMYMEYKVKESDSKLWQAGAILSNTPVASFPYLEGQMKFFQYAYDPEVCSNEPFFLEGAKYKYTFEKHAHGWRVKMERTIKGETSILSFPIELEWAGYDKDARFFSLWCGDGPTFPVNAVLENFKCYDATGKNLGVQSNKPQYECQIEKIGEIDSYDNCEAAYYCAEDESMFELYANKVLKYTKDGETKVGTYLVADHKLRVSVDEEDTFYDYLYQQFTAEDGRVYNRLQTYKVLFETGEGTEIESQKLNTEKGYIVTRPEDPQLKGNTFAGWYTSDGEEFVFDKVATESLTLYAKWEETDYASAALANSQLYLAIGLSALILIAAIVGGVMIVRRRRP